MLSSQSFLSFSLRLEYSSTAIHLAWTDKALVGLSIIRPFREGGSDLEGVERRRKSLGLGGKKSYTLPVLNPVQCFVSYPSFRLFR